mmetsp:Transcript_28032/g.62397  ORF Transcript_28032/g.62397 Transcript_28032/m.62397 type:complete len:192 (+) Transcript_28032:219-794(+)
MTDNSNIGDGLSSLISFTGLSIPARARFVAQCIGTAIYSSLTVGLVAGQTGAVLPCGPLVPFVTGSFLGYAWGCVGFWRISRKKAINCARRYPKILAHEMLTHFDIEVPENVDVSRQQQEACGREVAVVTNNRFDSQKDMTMEQWIQSGGVGRLSYAILATQGCEEDISDMQKNERQVLVEEYSGMMNNDE